VLRYGLALMLRRLDALSDVRIIAGRTITVTGTAGAPVQGDGDIITQLPLTLAIDRTPIAMVWPA